MAGVHVPVRTLTTCVLLFLGRFILNVSIVSDWASLSSVVQYIQYLGKVYFTIRLIRFDLVVSSQELITDQTLSHSHKCDSQINHEVGTP